MTTRGFDANVPARKPRPISRVLSELTTGSENGKPLSIESDATSAPPLAAAQRAPAARGGADVAIEPIAAAPTPEVTAGPATPKQSLRAARAESGRERTASLRERLAASTRGSVGEAEPQQTAAAVRELIDLLRAKLESALEEKSRLAGELDEARGALARSEAELKKERRTRMSLESQAEERRRIADEAVAEAEALAAERDQVLEEIAGMRGLENQAALLAEAEAELLNLDTRLQEAESGRARAEARCRELTAEVERLSAAGTALEALEALVRRAPGR